MEEIIDRRSDSEAQKSESSCLTRKSEGIKMKKRGSETEYRLKAIKCPRGLVRQISIILRNCLNCMK